MANLSLSMLMAGVALFGASGMAPVTFRTSNEPRTVTQANTPILTFWETFRSAVLKGDKETVAQLSRFPIARGYGMKSLRSKSQLMKRYRELFFAETDAAQCFPKARPAVEKERPGEFTVSCPFARDGGNEEPFVYTFTRTRTGWKFTSFENINE